MSIYKILMSLLMSFFMLISNGITAKITEDAPSPKSEAELLEIAEFFDGHDIADEVVVVSMSGKTKDEASAIQSLQGLVARDKAAIFINYGNDSATELEEIRKDGHRILYTDENGNNWTLKNLIPRYSSYIKDNGYVLFTDANTTEQINMAFNNTTVHGWLAVPESVESTVKELGMTKCNDLTDDYISISYQRDFYETYLNEFSSEALVHQKGTASGLRDFAVQQKIFITFTNDDNIIEKAFREEILKNLEPASPVLGWCQYEIKYTESLSAYGHYAVPSDHSLNMSILNCLDTEGLSLAEPVKAPEINPEKHYVAIVYSDGDNAQWISNGYKEFYDWQSYNIDAPVSWTFAPLMTEFSPVAMKKAIENAGIDSFISGPSGIGYGRISKMSADELASYSDKTAAIMKKTGLNTVTILDSYSDFSNDKELTNKLSYFSRYDNITGGILQLDPDRYAAGHGKVFFVDDKPFISMRLSLWYPSGNADEVTNEWLEEQAEIVNSYPADIKSINGYSVINVHPWTVGPDDLAYFVSQLDDGVEVISADELIAAVTQNVPHKTAQP